MPNVDVQRDQVVAPPLRWRELWLKEDWWAIWLGLGIVVVAYVFFANGANIRWIAVTPSKWSTLAQLGAHFAGNYDRYIVQWAMGPGEHLQSRTAAGGAGGRACPVKSHRLAALSRCRLSRRVLHQDRYRSARRDTALHAHRLGRSGRHPSGVDCLHRHVPGDLLGRDQAWAR